MSAKRIASLSALLFAWFLTAQVQELSSQQSSLPAQQLLNDVIWSVAHEGCDVFEANVMRRGDDLRHCFAEHQQTPEDAALVNQTSIDEITHVTQLALPRIYEEYTV